jgi:ElaB/YqjD/DUF883 family membrane-anchored ribosome-binding protein
MAEKTNITKVTPPQDIEQDDIARTREEMSETVNAIQDKISPGNVKTRAKDRIREATVDRVRTAATRISSTARDTSSTVLNTVKNNPVPLAMIGIGVSWLLYNRTRNGEGTMLSERGAAVKEKAGEMTEKAQAKFDELSGQMRQAGSEYASKAKYSAQRFRSVAKERAMGTQTRFQQMVQNNPFGVTLAAIAVGAALGFVIPESRKETEMMGSTSGSLLSKAKETAQRTIQKAQHAAEKGVETAEQEFKKTA